MKNLINTLIFAIVAFISTCKAQTPRSFTSAGTQDQYVPVVFGFTYKPFSISRPEIHENRNWLAYGIATINGIGYGWGSGNTMIKLENYTHGVQNSDNTGNWYSYIGKVICIWENTGILVYLRGGTTYYTDGNVIKNDGVDSSGKLSSVPITEPGFNIPRGIYIANWEINSNTQSMNIDNLYSKNGNIGIGNNSPLSKLDIASSKQNEYNYGDILIGDSTISMRLGTASEYSWIQSYGGKPLFMNRLGNNIVLNSQGGNVGIGVNNPKNKLDVNGTVHAKEVKVDMAGWADFVFHKDYELPTLDEVEKHIQEKGHLPNIPNTKEVTENGLSLGESQKLLLQKIEELTLYSIEQNKRIQKLEEKIKSFKKL
ncbi:hypothetical protein [Elizabethkingia meningoseptica]|uniref:hypothetical protein n=1 Tax=Elizabethkingia meningoseptica TaxID=238 RepID=UPI0023B001B1|nr:hypothetical protein [Elizabethkingia meningoseptica]